MSEKSRILGLTAAALVATAICAYGASNGGAWSLTIPGKGFKVNCGQSQATGRDCEMSTGYCILGDSWCQQFCLDINGQPTFANSQAVQVLCVGASGKSSW